MLSGTHVSIDDIRNQDILIYINGDLLHRKDAKISVFDSGYLVGDGIWEAMRLYIGTLVFFYQHI
jgi:branched-chain amino acid aminotransferase